jgi:glycopeptide antibiotics resistance protein
MTRRRLITALLLIAYCAVLIKVMVLKEVPTIHIGVLRLNFAGTNSGQSANFIPFRTIIPYLLGHNGPIIGGVNLIGNIVLLVPFGALLPPMLAKANWKAPTALAVAAGVSIECLQVLLRVGIFDIDDVILNAAGVIIGYAAYVHAGRWASAGRYSTMVVVAGLVTATGACATYAVYPKGDQPALVDEQTVTTPRDLGVTTQTSPSGANPCGETQGTGEITSVTDRTLSIKRNDGSIETLVIPAGAIIETSAGKISSSDLRLGDRVTVVVLDEVSASTILVCNPQEH